MALTLKYIGVDGTHYQHLTIREVDDDGKEEKMELWGYRINGHFRTDEVFHKKMGGTKRCFELVSIRYPNWIMRFKVERTTIRELVKKGIISRADLVKMVKKNKPS